MKVSLPGLGRLVRGTLLPPATALAWFASWHDGYFATFRELGHFPRRPVCPTSIGGRQGARVDRMVRPLGRIRMAPGGVRSSNVYRFLSGTVKPPLSSIAGLLTDLFYPSRAACPVMPGVPDLLLRRRLVIEARMAQAR
jgi:CubicO group peptidase (beta-lactamase class C family)